MFIVINFKRANCHAFQGAALVHGNCVALTRLIWVLAAHHVLIECIHLLLWVPLQVIPITQQNNTGLLHVRVKLAVPMM